MKEIGKVLDPLGGTMKVAGPMLGEGGSAPKGAGDQPILARQESEADVERRRLLAEQQARQRAARRGGYRALLSQQRLSPETGLQTTLGVA
jgi:hypothetical protein